MNTYCIVDENGICESVIHTRRTDWETSATCVIASGANATWVGTKQWNGNAWNEYTPPKRILSKYEFIQKLTPAVFAGILAAAKTDVEVDAYLQMAMAATEINLDDPNVGPGMSLLVAKGLLTSEQKDAILA